MLGDLTTVANVKAWMDISSGTTDVMIARTISMVSQVIRGHCNRSFITQVYTETYDGQMSQSLILRQYPVISVSALTIGTCTIQPQTSPVSDGYAVDLWNNVLPGNPSRLTLNCGWFYQGRANIAVTYIAGYQIVGEAQTVPSTTYQVTPVDPLGIWAADSGVVYASTGAALTPVVANPAAGQYVPPNPFGATPGAVYYQFNAADVNANVRLSYSFVPIDLEHVCIELVAERLSYRKRIGERSHSTGGSETVSFMITDLPPWAKLALSSYVRKVPL